MARTPSPELRVPPLVIGLCLMLVVIMAVAFYVAAMVVQTP
jgi:hypothetical protein